MAETRSALVVDDERDIRELLVMTLGRMGLRCDTASTIGEARSQLSRNRYDLCLTDMRLPDGSGMDLVAEISQRHPDTPVAMITAFGNVEAATKADPNMGMAQYQLGMTALNLGQIPEAIAALEAYLKVDPNGAKAAEVKAALPALQTMLKK